MNVAVAVGVGVGEPDAACRSKTQSGSPALLFPGVVKLWLPLFGNGEPEMFVNVSAVGSYHRAVTGPQNCPSQSSTYGKQECKRPRAYHPAFATPVA